MKRIAALLTGLFFSSFAFSGAGPTGFRTILSLESGPNGLEIRLAGGGTACQETVEGGITKTFALIGLGTGQTPNQLNAHQMTAVVLMAFASGRQINVYCPAGTWPTVITSVVVAE